MKKKSLLILGLLAISFISSLSAQTINATQTDEIIIDNGTSGKADPNDRIRYKVTIQNTAGPAGTNTQLNIVPDPRTTFVAGTFRSSPLAINDAYACTGNVGLNVPAASGLMANDFDDNIGGLTVTAGTFATTGGGSIMIATDGSFMYTPPAGLTGGGTDTYIYTLNDGNGVGGSVPATDMAVVTFTLSNIIWFVDNAVAGPGTGTVSDPFKTLAGATGASAASHIIFVKHTGTNYTGGIVLKNFQYLFGTGHTGGANLADAGVLPFTVAPNSKPLPAINGAHPFITNSAGGGILLALGNTIRGVDAGTTTPTEYAIRDYNGSVGDLSISDAIINNTTSGFRVADGGALNVTFGSITTSPNTGPAIWLQNTSGTFIGGSGSLNTGGGAAIWIYNGTVAFDYDGAVFCNTSNRLVHIINHATGAISLDGNLSNVDPLATGILITGCTSGVISFNGGTKTLSTGSNPAITLTSNTGTTINFTGGGLAITTTTGLGFNATGGGTVNVTGTGNTINSTTGTALNVVSTTIGASNLNFQSISHNGAGTGIVLNSTGTSGGLTVTGTGSAGSGGTIQNGAIGISLTSTRNVSLTRMQLNGFSDFAIRGTSVVNFTLDNTVVNGTNGDNAVNDEGSVRFTELTGSATISNCNISGGFEDNFRLGNTSGSLDRITFTGTTIGANSTTDGNDGITIETLNSAHINVTVQNCTFTSSRGDLFQFNSNASSGATDDLIFNNNALSNNHPGIATGGGGTSIFSNGSKDFTFDIDGNSFRDAVGHNVLLAKVGGAGIYQGTFSNNTIGAAGVNNSGSLEGSGLKIQTIGGGPAGTGGMTVAVTGNTVRQYNNDGILFQAGGGAPGDGTGFFNVTATGNTIGPLGTNTSAAQGVGIRVTSGTASGDNFQACVVLGGAGALKNILTNSGIAGSDSDFRVRQRFNTTIRLPDYAGGARDAAAVVTFIDGNNTITAPAPGGTATVEPVDGGGFVGGAACDLP